jgi:putative tryptophan/tyrosine transport system substrate-binding protein
MRRRDFLGLLGGAATGWPVTARAQQRAMPVIGFLGTETPDLWASRVRAFRQGLSETGYVEGQNVAIEFRWAESRNDRLPALATDLVARQVAVIATNGPATLVAKAATKTIPIVFQIGGDPVAVGLVASLNRPGGNLTGVTGASGELTPKKLELLHELVPTATTVALLIDPTNLVTGENLLSDVQTAAQILGLQLHVLRANTEGDLEKAFAELVQARAGGLVVASEYFAARSEQLGALTLRHAVPAIFQFREFAAAGGLMSYGSDLTERSRLVGRYTGRILKGEKPADLPVQQATKVELIINLKTARALGLTVPITLLGRADEVIE